MMQYAAHSESALVPPPCPECGSTTWAREEYVTCVRSVTMSRSFTGPGAQAGISGWKEVGDSSDEHPGGDFQTGLWTCFLGHEVRDAIFAERLDDAWRAIG